MNEIPSYFKDMNRVVILLHRLGLGPLISNPSTGYIMVVITTGRKTGLTRPTPVNYAWAGPASVYCLPGRGTRSDWYRNLLADPRAEVWIGGDAWAARAVPVTDPDEWVTAYRDTLVRSGFAAREYLDVDPKTATDDDLKLLGRDTPVMRLDLESRLCGPGGPGDLRWIWPAALALLALRWLIRRTRG